MTDPTDSGAEAELPLLEAPADPVPNPVATPAELAAAAAALARGTGSVAIDTERAHGFRYSNRAYLIQLRRFGTGTILLDPYALQPAGPESADSPTADLSQISAAISDAEWIIHAAGQDLPSLVEVGIEPRLLFDTELAGRLLNYPKVALGTLLEELIGVRLLKQHSAANWSERPLPQAWLVYAALDVELLVELRNRLDELLVAAEKREWAEQEFQYLVANCHRPVPARVDPWRRTSQIHRARTPRGLALVRHFWQVRDEIARAGDIAPGRVLIDVAIAELASLVGPGFPGVAEMRKIEGFQRRKAIKYAAKWTQALADAAQIPPAQWPPANRVSDGPPPARAWPTRNPKGADRLARARGVLTELAQKHNLPPENLLAPETVRRLTWDTLPSYSAAAIDDFLAQQQARPWQRELTVKLLAAKLSS